MWWVTKCLLLLGCLASLVHSQNHENLNTTATTDPGKQAEGPKVVISINNKQFVNGYLPKYDRTQQKVDPNEIGGILIEEEAKNIATKLRMLTNNELGVLKMQKIFDSLQYKEVQPDYTDKLNMFVERMQDKFASYLKVLKTNRLTVENLYASHRRKPINHVYECCNVPKSDLSYDSHYHCAVTRTTTCELVPPNLPEHAFIPGRNLTEMFQLIPKAMYSIKWQYFISSQGVHSEFPAHNFGNVPFSDCKNKHDQRHRSVYISTVHPMRKNVLIVVENGKSLSESQFQTGKAIAQHVISSLSENDRVGIFGLSSQVTVARSDGCLSTMLCPLTVESQLYLNNFVSRLQQQQVPTNHSLGFDQAFKMIWNTLNPDNKTITEEQALIVYISRGLLTTLTEAKGVMRLIAQQNGRLRHKVVINTYFLGEVGKPVMYEKTFLRDIAGQNFSKYLLDQKYPGPVPLGSLVSVSSDRDLSTLVGNFSDSFHWAPSFDPKVSLPIKDTVGEGVVIPVTWPCRYNNSLIGMVGLDIHLSDIVEDVTYFTKERNAYAFLINDKGLTIMHPSLDRPIIAKTQPVHTDILHLEHVPGFKEVKQKILTKANDSHVLIVPRYTNDTYYSDRLNSLSAFKVTYVWKHVYVEKLQSSPYIFVIKTIDDGFKMKDISWKVNEHRPQVVYHRIDLIPANQMCIHMKQLATMDTSLLYLSANSFLQPFKHLNSEEIKRMVQGYVLYLNDNTGLLSNTEIRKDIGEDISSIAKINEEWIKPYEHSSMKNYIVRRYVATPSGAFYMYPGTLMNKLYDPLKRDWYTRAMKYPGLVTMTAPYLDNGGAGYIVTVSHTIYEGKTAGLHGPYDHIKGVMGMDLTLGFFYKLLVDEIPLCEQANMRCFLMDDRGYLIAHPGLIEPNGRGPVEEKHITRKEALVANDILNHVGFVQKRLCNTYNDRTIQRYYQFNTSLNKVLTNLVHGEPYAKYQIAPIPGTNLFLGVVNQTSDVMRAFCPCSMIDRLCLNCKRMEQSECECPCECPLEMNFCTGDLLKQEDSNPTCPTFQEDIAIQRPDLHIMDKLHQCYNPRCDSRKTKQACLGVIDCAWCVQDRDGRTLLQKPFCSTQRTCFAGVLGSRTPYADDLVYTQEEKRDPPTTIKSTPVGPVAGGIMACFLVLALGVYCYRHRVHRQTHQYMTAAPDSQYRMGFEEPIEDLDPENEPNLGPGGGHTNIVLATFDSPVSPYRVNADYRRPGPASESDLGYSTMTPHEDSEQASTCVEPIGIIGRERYRPSPLTTAAIASRTMCGTPIIPPPPPSTRRSHSPTSQLVNLKDDSDKTVSMELETLNSGSLVPGQTVLPGQQGLMGGTNPQQTVLPSADMPNVILAPVQVHMVDSH